MIFSVSRGTFKKILENGILSDKRYPIKTRGFGSGDMYRGGDKYGQTIEIENMKPYTTKTQDTCWKDSLACLLEVEPKKIPDFVKKYGDSYMDETRKWLKEKYGKGLIYVAANAFMETGKLRFNGCIGPEGYSIGYMNMVDDSAAHALVCFNGGVFWDNGDERHKEYDTIGGYFVLYDLGMAKVKKRKSKKKVKLPKE